MGRYHEAFWEPDPTQLSRRGRRGGPYKWYEPTRLSELDLALSGDVVSDVLRAEDALAARRGGSATNTEGIARLLLRADAVALPGRSCTSLTRRAYGATGALRQCWETSMPWSAG